MASKPWSDDYARLVIALAVFGDLLAKLPGAFTPALFGDASSPRQRIAGVIADYAAKRGVRPAPAEVSEGLRREMAVRSAPERQATADEWLAIQSTTLPDDPADVFDEVRGWIDYTRMEQALLDASTALADGQDGLVRAREILAKAEPITLSGDRLQVQTFLGGAEQRMDVWRNDDDVMGDRIATGLGPLDAALKGGPTRKETWYFLAPPKGAKTTALLRVARGAAVRGYGVYLTTFEMQATRMLLRADRMAANRSKEELRVDLKALQAVFTGMRASGSGEIYVQEQPTQRRGSVAAVARTVEKIRREGGKIDVVIFDYLNIMGSLRNEKEKRFELAAISREMADLAKDLNVLVWSAALVNRKAVEKETIKKTDIAEAFEVIAVCDGTVSICAPPGLVQNSARRMWVAAAREEQDEILAGDYKVNFPRMALEPISQAQANAWIVSGRAKKKTNEEESAV